MKKLRLAILGKNEKNLDDLSHMDGESVTTKFFSNFACYFRVCAHFRFGIVKLSGSKILKQTYVYR